jgi:hypothetical protein
LATLGEPLNRLVKKEQPFVWGKEQDAAFVKLKEALANASITQMFYRTKICETSHKPKLSLTLLSALESICVRYPTMNGSRNK